MGSPKGCLGLEALPPGQALGWRSLPPTPFGGRWASGRGKPLCPRSSFIRSALSEVKFPRAVDLKLVQASECPGGLSQRRSWALPGSVRCRRSEAGPSNCISNKFLSDSTTASPGTTRGGAQPAVGIPEGRAAPQKGGEEQRVRGEKLGADVGSPEAWPLPDPAGSSAVCCFRSRRPGCWRTLTAGTVTSSSGLGQLGWPPWEGVQVGIWEKTDSLCQEHLLCARCHSQHHLTAENEHLPALLELVSCRERQVTIATHCHLRARQVLCRKRRPGLGGGAQVGT